MSALERDPSTAWLIVRRGGGLWGVRHGSLRELTGARPQRLELKSGETLLADELLSLAAGLRPRPFPRCLRRFFPPTVFGLAVWRDRPVVLLDSGAPPPACLAAESHPGEV